MAASMSQYEDKVFNYFSREKTLDAQCLFCKSHTKSVTKFKKLFLDIHQCECGFVYLKNTPHPEVLSKFYKESDALTEWAEIKKSDKELDRQRSKFSKAIDIINRSHSPDVLDLGCGNGVFLKLLRDSNPKSRCVGVDTNISASKVAESANCLIIRQEIEKYLAGNTGQFDYITLWGVLEHVRNPEQIVSLIKPKLKGMKRVIVCVPNINSLACLILKEQCFTFCPQHLWYYSLKTLRRLFREFELITSWTIEPEDQPIRRFTEGYKPYDNSIQVETKTAIKSLGRDYDSLPEYILQENLGYKIVAVFQA